MGEFKNNLEQIAKELDPDNLEVKYNLPKDFQEKTGIHYNRFWKIFKNPDEGMTLEEAEKIAQYYAEKSGIKISASDLIKK